MIVKLAAAVLLSILATASSATAQNERDSNCRDDRGVDRCSEEQQRRVRTLYGVRSIEEHQAAGDEVRRVFYVDGYGNDLVMIAFVRAPGRDPAVWIHHPQREGEPRSEPIQAAVPQAVWNDVIERSAVFHRSFIPQPRQRRTSSDEEETVVVCLHSWVYTIEAVDRPEFDAQPQIRRKTEDACEDGPGEAFVQQLGNIARSLFPHCAALDVEQYRNAAVALAACRILRGDRLAAAEVLNSAGAFINIEGPGDARLVSGLFDPSATLSWNGEQYRGNGFNAGEFWAARVGAQQGRTLSLIHI